MIDANEERSVKWLIVFGVLCIVYGAFRLVFGRPFADKTALPHQWDYAIIVLFLCGAMGLFFRNQWAILFLTIVSSVVVLEGAYMLAAIALYLMHALVSFYGLLLILFFLVPLYGWPAFLVYWLHGHRLSGNISSKTLR
jgi:hypothetical protein